MPEPSVCAVLLTANRPAMTAQAVASFRAQTYQNKRLLIYDSGALEFSCATDEALGCGPEISHISWPRQSTVGHLRNLANSFYTGYGHESTEIILHFDSDDLSHSSRIAEQVALLQSSGADVVGYNEALFWREPQWEHVLLNEGPPREMSARKEPGEAWLYRNPDPRYAIGSSLCYWRKTWERNPFPATSHGEDAEFIRRLNCVGMSSAADPVSPRLLCRIHPGNTSTAYAPHKLKLPEWRRVPEWDDYCAREFAK